jgi:hypothetical protein
MRRTMVLTDLRVSGFAMALALALIFGAARYTTGTESCGLCPTDAVPTTVDVVASSPMDCEGAIERAVIS